MNQPPPPPPPPPYDEENPALMAEEDDPVVGFRQSRRDTNAVHRWDALSQQLARLARNLFLQATSYFSLLRTLFRIGTTLYIFIQMATERGIPREFFVRARSCFVAVYMSACFVYTNGFKVFFQAFKDIVCIRASHRANDPAMQAENAPKNRRIDDLSPDEAYRWTRFTKAQLYLLLLHLRIPEWLPSTTNRYRFTGEEVLLVSLTRIDTGEAFYNFIPSKFGGGPAAKWSKAFKWFIDHTFNTFYHKITGNSMLQWTGHVDFFRTVITNKVAEVPVSVRRIVNGVETTLTYAVTCDIETFRIFGFIDDTGVPTCIPGGSGLGFVGSLQRAFYSRYFRGHGIKFQVVLLLNGMIGSVFGASWNNNDDGILNLSGLADYLRSILQPIGSAFGNFFPAIYGDGIFAVSATIFGRYRAPLSDWEEIVNIRMALLLVCIEHLFSSYFNLFKLLKTTRQMTVMRTSADKLRLCTICFFLLNCYTCMNGSATNTTFGTVPPSIDEYLSLDEVLEAAPPQHERMDRAEFDERYRYNPG